MASIIGSLLGFGVQISFLVGLITAILLYVWLPFMAWSMTRNVRQIRVQLERLNDNLESNTGGSRVGTLKI